MHSPCGPPVSYLELFLVLIQEKRRAEATISRSVGEEPIAILDRLSKCSRKANSCLKVRFTEGDRKHHGENGFVAWGDRTSSTVLNDLPAPGNNVRQSLMRGRKSMADERHFALRGPQAEIWKCSCVGIEVAR